MSRLSSFINQFFNRRSLEIAGKLLLKLLQAFAGRVGGELADAAMREVQKAEASGKSGAEKFEAAFVALRTKFKDKKEITDRLIRAAIEVTVERIDPKIPPYMRQ